MSIFPVLNYDNEAQVGDKVRFDISKSFVSKGSGAITTATIQPADDEAVIDVFATDPQDMYLDWMYKDYKADVTADNNIIDFEISGVTGQGPATLTPGTYTLEGLRAEVEAQINAAALSGAYTVVLDEKDRFKISSDASFKLLPQSGDNFRVSALGMIGFSKDTNTSRDQQGSTIDKLPRRITVELGDGITTETITNYQYVYSPYGDSLFSDDSDLVTVESKIFRYLDENRSSYNHMHREAQKNIIEYLDREGYVNIYKQKYNKFDFIDHSEVKEWSKYLTLRLVYQDLKNSQGDHWQDKLEDALNQEIKKRARAVLRLDVNADGKIDEFNDEHLRLKSSEVLRR